tara:strand:- start:193 stop:1161 length:969 start_codon:yes stop_codon:yes gene_type:complete
MTDDDAPSRGRTRTSARQRAAPLGEGWDPIERCDWEAVTTSLTRPWPLGAQRHDLRYWASRQRAHKGDRPGYRALAERWGVTEKSARVVCADVMWWSDPRFGDEHPTRAHQGRTEGAPRAHEGRTEGAPRAPKDNSDRDKNSHTDREANTSAPPPERAEKRRPTAAERATAEAEDLLRRLDALRLQRHPSGRPLKAETWVPKLRSALKRQTAQEVIDGWTWVLRSPEAAWHRGEARGGTDRTRDLALVLGHPEYAARRTWRGLEAAHEHDLEARPAESLPVQVQPLTPYQIAVQERERREQAENDELRRKMAAEINDDDIPF